MKECHAGLYEKINEVETEIRNTKMAVVEENRKIRSNSNRRRRLSLKRGVSKLHERVYILTIALDAAKQRMVDNLENRDGLSAC